MTDDPAFYARALRRITWIAIGAAAAASLYVGFRFTWTDALGCAVAASAAIWNFTWWKRLTAGMDPSSETPARPASAAFLGMRYLILGGICFVIIKVFGVNYLALLIGLLAPVAAVLAEMVLELVIIRDRS